MQVAALFVQRAGVYYGLDGVDPFTLTPHPYDGRSK